MWRLLQALASSLLAIARRVEKRFDADLLEILHSLRLVLVWTPGVP